MKVLLCRVLRYEYVSKASSLSCVHHHHPPSLSFLMSSNNPPHVSLVHVSSSSTSAPLSSSSSGATTPTSPSSSYLINPFPNSPGIHTLTETQSTVLLKHTLDRFNGVIITPTALPNSQETFSALLSASLSAWSSTGRRGVWLQIPIHLSVLIPIAAQAGFVFHHAHEKAVMMTLWLPEWTYKQNQHKSNQQQQTDMQAPAEDKQKLSSTRNHLSHPSPSSSSSSNTPAVVAAVASESPLPYEASVLPSYHTTSLGVGAIVLNKRGELLAIIERYSPLPDFWKLPGGAVDQGEDLTVAVQREVLEETGIHCHFHCILGFRHLLQFRFGGGDLYLLCVCLVDEHDGGEIESIRMQESEIMACKWMVVEEFFGLPSTAWFAPVIAEPLAEEMELLFPAWTGKDKLLQAAQKLSVTASKATTASSASIVHTPNVSTPAAAGMVVRSVTSPVTGKTSNFYVVSSKRSCSNQNNPSRL